MGEVMLFDEGSSNVPAHIRAAHGRVKNTDLSEGVSTGFPRLSYKGKAWHVDQGGTRTLITGDDNEPRSSVEVVILKSNPHISKIYYVGGYVEGSTESPTCYSDDGITPAVGASEPQSAKCAICPHNQWGSRITEGGAKGKDCSDSRRLAVAPAGDIEGPMLLRCPAATLKDLKAYADMLDKRETPYSAVVTKIGFDHTVAYPKLTFKAVRWLTAEEVVQVSTVLESSVVAAIIADDAPPAGADPLSDLAGERPANIAEATAKVTPAQARALATADEVAAAVTPVEAVKVKAATKTTKAFSPAEVQAAQAAVVAETVAAKGPTEAEIKRAALLAQLAELDAPATVAAEPEAVEEVKPKRDHSKLLSEASAGLEEVLGILDDA